MTKLELDYSIGKLDSNSVRELRDIDCRLCSVVLLAAARYHAAFGPRRLRVTAGRRTEEEQEALVASGASRTMNSRHLTGRAVDLAIIIGKNKAVWDWSFYRELDGYMQKAATDIGLDEGDLLWGGHWVTLRDGVHWELMIPEL